MMGSADMKEDSKQSIKREACNFIDLYASQIIDFGREFLAHPELGYKETYSSSRILEIFSSLGVKNISRPALTGVKGWLLHNPGPRVAIIGELDAVLSPHHPLADKSTGAAHACGHNAQLAAMLGCAIGLRAVGNYLDGSVCLIAAPAEEYIEIGWRNNLRQTGKLYYLGGKQQLIFEGAFDDIDLAIMIHSETNAPNPRIVIGGNANGFIGKELCFRGKEAHAGGAPWEGINALNAATLAITAINANRETFRDEDRVRVHSIITKGGELVNTVPSEVHMESYVRAASVQAMSVANRQVNRAVRGAAYAIGAQVEITDIPGYLPLVQNEFLSQLFKQNASDLLPNLRVEKGIPFCGSTDMGDVSYIMPAVQPTISGFSGAAHSKDFQIIDEELAYLVPAKLMTATIIDLLYSKANCAYSILGKSPSHTRDEYNALWQDILKQST